MLKKPRKRQCKHCSKVFQPTRSFQKGCKWSCEFELAKKYLQKLERKRLLSRKRALKTKRELIKEVHVILHKLVRKRDEKDPCISCGKKVAVQWHAGHYMPTSTHSAIRFDLDNIHKQCSRCNAHLHGNLIFYRQNLIEKIGLQRVKQLESARNLRKYSKPELMELKKLYSSKVKELRNKH